MPRYAYVDGRYVPHALARVHVEDRGYQFADGVYEVILVVGGRLVDEEPHLDRLGYSLAELRIAWPTSRAVLRLVLRELIRRNGIQLGIVYLQMTRGQAPRDHKFPQRSMPTLVATTRRLKPPAPTVEGVAVITRPDIRWRRCDIKSIALLPNVLRKQEAAEAGAFETWLVDDEGFVVEGTSTNAWIVDAGNRLVTRDLGTALLAGITRRAVLQLAAEHGVGVEERRFSVGELRAASEAMLTSTTSFVLPVTSVDGRPIGNGRPGHVTMKLRDIYMRYVAAAPT
jgi:D-alanine transaminase